MLKFWISIMTHLSVHVFHPCTHRCGIQTADTGSGNLPLSVSPRPASPQFPFYYPRSHSLAPQTPLLVLPSPLHPLLTPPSLLHAALHSMIMPCRHALPQVLQIGQWCEGALRSKLSCASSGLEYSDSDMRVCRSILVLLGGLCVCGVCA